MIGHVAKAITSSQKYEQRKEPPTTLAKSRDKPSPCMLRAGRRNKNQHRLILLEPTNIINAFSIQPRRTTKKSPQTTEQTQNNTDNPLFSTNKTTT